MGLWKAVRRFGPNERGALRIERRGDAWSADFMGRSHPVRTEGSELAFELPAERGSFRGRLDADGRAIRGHWTSAASVIHGFRYASPLTLLASGRSSWAGTVSPREDSCTFYLKVTKGADGVVRGFLRNPERNLGNNYDIDRLVRDGNDVRFFARGVDGKPAPVLLTGKYDPAGDVQRNEEHPCLSVVFSTRGGTYDFHRDLDDESGFYPRGKNPARYAYRAPLARGDGWPTSTSSEVSIDTSAVERFVQSLSDMPIESLKTPEVEAVLVARHGKLALEEYFHGFDRDRLHETRSAAKSLTATVAGAAMQAGIPVSLSSPVYRVMNAGAFPEGLEPRKQAMTLENLLTMRSGYFCDDRNPAAPGNEDTMIDQYVEGDYYRYTLRLPLDRDPGAAGVYCSIDPNLALGVIGRAAGKSPLVLFDSLVAEPLQISAYAWPLSPAGQPYGGGSVQILPRDFLKVAQVMLDGGRWKGHPLVSRDFATRATSPLHDLRGIQYGYLWWSIVYPYKNRTVRAFFAGGNGGQVVMGVPELDLAIAIFAGNYADRVALHVQQDLIPNFLLPAVRERGDDPIAPVAEQHFATPYGREPEVDGGFKTPASR